MSGLRFLFHGWEGARRRAADRVGRGRRGRAGGRGGGRLAGAERGARPPRSRSQRPSDHDRHASCRRPRRLRAGGGGNALDRPAGGRGSALRARPCPQRDHAAVTREPTLRPVSLSPRRARQQRLPVPGRDPDARHAAQGTRLAHRGLRQRLSPRVAVRSRRRLRGVRRPPRGGGGAHGVPGARAARRGHGRGRPPVAGRAPRRAHLLLRAPLRAPLSLRPARAFRVALPERALPRRGGRRRRGARAAAAPAARGR